MRLRRIGAIAFVVGAGFGLVRGVEAGVPAKCGGKREQAVYKTGVAQGWSLVDAAFDGLGRDCKRLAELRALAESLSSRRPEQGTEVLECKTLGFHHGIQSALTEIMKGCPK